MRKFGFTAVAAGLIGGAILLPATAWASAATLAGPAFAAPGDTVMVEQVHSRNGERANQYDSRRHGQRYRQARSGYRHHHNGYYYSSPWWAVGSTIEHGLSIPGAVIHGLFR